MVSLNPEAAGAVSHTVPATAIIVALIIGIPILAFTLFAIGRLCRGRSQKKKAAGMNDAIRVSPRGVAVRDSGIS